MNNPWLPKSKIIAVLIHNLGIMLLTGFLYFTSHSFISLIALLFLTYPSKDDGNEDVIK